MVTQSKVFKILNVIRAQGFSVASYYYHASDAEAFIQICSIEAGGERRYFTVSESEDEGLQLGFYSQPESCKLILQVCGPIAHTIRFQTFVAEGYAGILRQLGMYRLLFVFGGLKLSDFKPIPVELKAGLFAAYRVDVDTLQKKERLSISGLNTQEAAHIAARRWHGSEFAVVCNHEGSVVAVYHHGKSVF